MAGDARHEARERVRVRHPFRRAALVHPAEIDELHVEPADLLDGAEHVALQLQRHVPGRRPAHGRVHGEDEPPASGAGRRRECLHLGDEGGDLGVGGARGAGSFVPRIWSRSRHRLRLRAGGARGGAGGRLARGHLGGVRQPRLLPSRWREAPPPAISRGIPQRSVTRRGQKLQVAARRRDVGRAHALERIGDQRMRPARLGPGPRQPLAAERLHARRRRRSGCG